MPESLFHPPLADRTLVLAEQLKALGHPIRLQIIQRLLSEQDCCCGQLCASFEQSQSTISQHLGVLKDAGLLINDKRGNRMHYALDMDAMNKISDQLSALPKLCKGATEIEPSNRERSENGV